MLTKAAGSIKTFLFGERELSQAELDVIEGYTKAYNAAVKKVFEVESEQNRNLEALLELHQSDDLQQFSSVILNFTPRPNFWCDSIHKQSYDAYNQLPKEFEVEEKKLREIQKVTSSQIANNQWHRDITATTPFAENCKKIIASIGDFMKKIYTDALVSKHNIDGPVIAFCVYAIERLKIFANQDKSLTFLVELKIFESFLEKLVNEGRKTLSVGMTDSGVDFLAFLQGLHTNIYPLVEGADIAFRNMHGVTLADKIADNMEALVKHCCTLIFNLLAEDIYVGGRKGQLIDLNNFVSKKSAIEGQDHIYSLSGNPTQYDLLCLQLFNEYQQFQRQLDTLNGLITSRRGEGLLETIQSNLKRLQSENQEGQKNISQDTKSLSDSSKSIQLFTKNGGSLSFQSLASCQSSLLASRSSFFSSASDYKGGIANTIVNYQTGKLPGQTKQGLLIQTVLTLCWSTKSINMVRAYMGSIKLALKLQGDLWLLNHADGLKNFLFEMKKIVYGMSNALNAVEIHSSKLKALCTNISIQSLLPDVMNADARAAASWVQIYSQLETYREDAVKTMTEMLRYVELLEKHVGYYAMNRDAMILLIDHLDSTLDKTLPEFKQAAADLMLTDSYRNLRLN